MKRLAPRVVAINALEPRLVGLSDDELRGRIAGDPRADPRSTRRSCRTSTSHGARHVQAVLDEQLEEVFAIVREAGEADPRDAPLRRPAHRRHGAPRRQDRRDEDRRGQDPGRHAAGRPQRPHRPRRPRRHGQRLPGQARRRVDGPDLHLPRPDGRLHPEPDGRRGAARRPTAPTSPTAPTTSSASTTCATT